MNRSNPCASLFLSLALVLVALSGLSRVGFASTGGAQPASPPQHVIPPGDSHSNGDVTVTNASNSRGNANEDPWQGAEDETTTAVRTGQQFLGSIVGLDGNDTAYLGSRSGTETDPVQVTGSSGTITLGSDTWAHCTNSGNGTLTVRDVAGNTLASFGHGEGGTVHHP